MQHYRGRRSLQRMLVGLERKVIQVSREENFRPSEWGAPQRLRGSNMGRHSLTRRLTAVTLTFALAWSLALISGVTSKASADLVEKIFFTSYDNNQVPEVSAINPDGSGVAVSAPGDSPQSSPDGTKLVF